MLAWIKFIVKEHKAIASFVIFIMSISGVSIYGNVNELNPWKPASEVVEEIPTLVSMPISVPKPQIKVIEKTIETRVESGITEQDVTNLLNAATAAHIEEYH